MYQLGGLIAAEQSIYTGTIISIYRRRVCRLRASQFDLDFTGLRIEFALLVIITNVRTGVEC